MIGSYKIRLEPNKTQTSAFFQNAQSARHAYNWALSNHISATELAKQTAKLTNSSIVYPKISSFKWSAEYTQYKKNVQWLKDASKWPAQQALRHLESAFQKFFKKGGFPKFKKYSDATSYTTGAVSIGYDYIRLPKIGKVKLSRKGWVVDKDTALSLATVSFDGQHWVVSFHLKNNNKPKPLAPLQNITEQDIIGVDLGIKELAIVSDGTAYQNPKAYKKYLKKIKRCQRQLSKKKKGSKNRQRCKTKLKKLHNKIRNIRQDNIHKMTSSIVKSQPKMIVIETLKPKNMMKNHKLAGSIADAAFGEIARQFTYKSEWNGIHLIKAGQFYPSSQFCSCCGHRKKDLTLKDREWKCINCDAEHDRDVNAARNLRFYGNWLVSQSTEGSSESYACGGERLQFCEEQCSPTKQEFLKSKIKYFITKKEHFK